MSLQPRRVCTATTPFPDQTESNKIYGMCLQHPAAEEDQSLLEWLRCHRTSGNKPKAYDVDKVLVGVKFVSIFNPIYFYQYLTIHHLHRSPTQLSHTEEESMPSSICFFSQAAALTTDHWSSPESIAAYFSRESHKEYFVHTIVSFVKSL